MFPSPHVADVPAPEMVYTDDLVSLSTSLLGLQLKADIVLAYAIVAVLKIVQNKLRGFSMDWTAAGAHSDTSGQECLVLHSVGWVVHDIMIKQGGSIKCLGVHYDLDLSGHTQKQQSVAEFNRLLAAAKTRAASEKLSRR